MSHSLSRIAAAVTLTLALGMASPTAAADRLVPQQYATIGLALDAALSGDTIVISAGIYDECVQITGLEQLEVIGKRGSIIDAAGCDTGLAILDGSGIVLKGLTITNGTDQAILIAAGVSEVIITKSSIVDGAFDPASSILETGVSILGADDVTLDNVDIKGARQHAIYVESATATVIKKSKIIDGIGDGIRVDLGTGLKIEKNVFENLGGPAIHFFHDLGVGVLGGGVESLILSNKVLLSPGGGLVIGGANNLIEKNKVVLSGARGIVALSNGGGSIYRKNKVDRATETGIVAGGTEDTFEKNRVKLSGGTGVEVTGIDNLFLGVKSIEAAGSGFVVALGAIGNEFTLCSSSKSAVDGFHVEGILNTFVKSTAAGSGNLDLNDAAGNATTNTYLDCKFKTSNVN